MGFAALGGPRGAPGHTLTPEILRPKQLLHLLPSDLDAGLSHYQACEERQKKIEREGDIEKADRTRMGEKKIRRRGEKRQKVLVNIIRERGEQVKTNTHLNETADIIYT